MKINFYWTQSLVFNSDILTSVLTFPSDFIQFSEIMTMQQTGSTVYKLKPRSFWQVCIIKLLARSFIYSIYLWANPVDFYSLVWAVPDTIKWKPGEISLFRLSKKGNTSFNQLLVSIIELLIFKCYLGVR